MKYFPILRGGQVPWDFVIQFRTRLMSNHSQTVERLAERGGLSWAELYLASEDRKLFGPSTFPDERESRRNVEKKIAEWAKKGIFVPVEDLDILLSHAESEGNPTGELMRVINRLRMEANDCRRPKKD